MLERYWPKFLNVNFAIALFCLVLIGIVWAMTLDRINFERTETIAHTAKQNANLAIALEEQTLRTLKSVDQVALFVKDQYLDDGLKLNLPEIIKGGMIDTSIVLSINIIDAHGDLLLSNIAFKPTNVADREYFKFHQQQDKNQMLVGKPDFGRVTGKWTIHMTRRINKADGSFGGVVLAAVDPNYFTNFYQKADLGEQGLVSLVGLDGIARANSVPILSCWGPSTQLPAIRARSSWAGSNSRNYSVIIRCRCTRSAACGLMTLPTPGVAARTASA